MSKPAMTLKLALGIVRSNGDLFEALVRVAARYADRQMFCRNCGDAFDDDAANAANAALDKSSGSWRPLSEPIARPAADRLRRGRAHVHE